MDGRGITEAEVEAALPDDNGSLLVRYVAYAKTQVGSPLAYHVGSALMMLSMLSPQMWCASRGFLAPTTPNMWSMLVGRSGEAMKTLAIAEMRKFISAVGAEVAVGADPASEEAFVKALTKRPQQCLVYDDMGSFLANTSSAGHNYRARILDKATEVYDGTSFDREKAGRMLKVYEPRLSIFGGCTPVHVETYTTVLHWEGGFMSRFLTMYAEAERDVRYRADDEAAWSEYEWILARVRAMWEAKASYDAVAKRTGRGFWFGRDPSSPLGQCLGLGDGADALWQSWRERIVVRVRALPDRLAGVGSRTPLMAAKVATLLSWDRFVRERMEAPSEVTGDWAVDAEDMRIAIAVAELGFRSTVDLTRKLASSDDARQKRVALAAVGEVWTSQAEILQESGMLRKKAAEALETLREEGLIERQKAGGVMNWRRCRPTAEEAAQNDASDVAGVLQFPRPDADLEDDDGDDDESENENETG